MLKELEFRGLELTLYWSQISHEIVHRGLVRFRFRNFPKRFSEIIIVIGLLHVSIFFFEMTKIPKSVRFRLHTLIFGPFI
jgi:hypothetical protein